MKMERRRPSRELKNSEDVQDALIEDYFRYNDLSRMKADDILMNISEIEIPNYEYVELDLLNLPNRNYSAILATLQITSYVDSRNSS